MGSRPGESFFDPVDIVLSLLTGLEGLAEDMAAQARFGPSPEVRAPLCGLAPMPHLRPCVFTASTLRGISVSRSRGLERPGLAWPLALARARGEGLLAIFSRNPVSLRAGGRLA